MNMTYEEAAAVPMGGLTALHLLRKGDVQRGQEVLVYGASGSVGTFAVQLAGFFGAQVTGICNTSNIAMVKSLGAARVFDYTQESFTGNGQTYASIVDAVMKTSFSRCKSLLEQRGVYMIVDYPLLQALWTSILGSRKVVFGTANGVEDLIFLKELIGAERIKPVIDGRYTLEQIVEAHRYVEKGHKKGNAVMAVEHNNKI